MAYELIHGIYPRTDVFDKYINEEIRNIDTSLIKFHDELNPDIFINEKLKPEVRKILINVINYFLKSIVDDLIFETVTITGSIVNYNYTKYSDIDLHIIINKNEYKDNDFEKISDLVATKSKVWNSEHENIKMFGHNIEIYLQDESEEHRSSGIYDIMCDDWILKPQKQYKDIDIEYLKSKFTKIVDKINTALQYNELNKIENFIDNIKLYRKSGLEKEGEYSYENIIYKMIKHFGYMSKLYDLKRKLEIENK
jgi:predicted nucleotidyltransferase